jgi:EpsD family peptidyl-prolyl cis-trans isomerase
MNKSSFCGLVCLLSASLLVGGCGNKDKSEAGTQVAAKVNGDEITVHQIGFALARANVSSPEQMKQASRQALDRLIEQDLLVQAAVAKKLDRDPRVLQAVEAAKREVIARAYLEQVVGNSIPKAADQDVKTYYDQHPALFSARRIFDFREVAVQNAPGAGEKIRKQLGKSSNVDELVAWLKSESMRFAEDSFSKPAEQLPLESLSQFQTMKDGDIKFSEAPQTLVVLQLVSSRNEPIDEAKAKPLIEQFLVNRKRAEVAKSEIDRLRGEAKIELVGDFADAGSNAPAQSPAPSTSANASSPGLENGIKGLK